MQINKLTEKVFKVLKWFFIFVLSFAFGVSVFCTIIGSFICTLAWIIPCLDVTLRNIAICYFSSAAVIIVCCLLYSAYEWLKEVRKSK